MRTDLSSNVICSSVLNVPTRSLRVLRQHISKLQFNVFGKNSKHIVHFYQRTDATLHCILVLLLFDQQPFFDAFYCFNFICTEKLGLLR